MPAPLIEVSNVTHHYGLSPVLRDVSLTVSEGELIALMGPNGMGKSTLLSIIAGVMAPVLGQVAVNGRARRSSAANELVIRQQIAYLPAEPWMPWQRTGRQWALSVGRLYGVPDDRLLWHVDQLLDVFDLTPKADALLMNYSTGQKKKAAVITVLATDAPILLLDEPFAGGLDPSAIVALKRILLHHRQHRDRTVIIATPVPELVDELADHVGVIQDGRLVVFDSPANLRAQTATSTLEAAYQKIVNPQTVSKVDRYLSAASQ